MDKLSIFAGRMFAIFTFLLPNFKNNFYSYPMLQIPKPMLGEVNSITIATADLEKSLLCYQLLGFSELWRSDFPFPLILINDGAIQIMLRKGDEPYLGLAYYVKEVDSMAAQLEAEGIVFHQKPKASDMVKRYMTKSPDGLNLTLVTFMD